MAVSTMSCTSPTLMPWRATALRSILISRNRPPCVRSAYKSAAPGTFRRICSASIARPSSVSRSLPKIFTPRSVRTPVESMLIRLMIGCVQPLRTPGIWSFESSSAIMSFFVIPFRHWFFGLRSTMDSIMLTGAGSVEVSAFPTFPSTCSTSGTDLMIASCSCTTRLTSVIDADGSVTGMNRRLPSSSGGMNSDPMFMTIGIVMSKAITLRAMVVFRHLRTQRITGAYTQLRKRVMGF